MGVGSGTNFSVFGLRASGFGLRASDFRAQSTPHAPLGTLHAPCHAAVPLWIDCSKGDLQCAAAVMRGFGGELVTIFVAAFFVFVFVLLQVLRLNQRSNIAIVRLHALKRSTNGDVSRSGEKLAAMSKRVHGTDKLEKNVERCSKFARTPSFSAGTVSSGSRFSKPVATNQVPLCHQVEHLDYSVTGRLRFLRCSVLWRKCASLVRDPRPAQLTTFP